MIEIRGAGVDQEDVHPAVVVEVEEGAAGSHGFREVALGGEGVVVGPDDAGVGVFDEEGLPR